MVRVIVVAQNVAFSPGKHAGKFYAPDVADPRGNQRLHGQGAVDGVVIRHGEELQAPQAPGQLGGAVGAVGGGRVDVQIKLAGHGIPSSEICCYYSRKPKKPQGKQKENSTEYGNVKKHVI